MSAADEDPGPSGLGTSQAVTPPHDDIDEYVVYRIADMEKALSTGMNYVESGFGAHLLERVLNVCPHRLFECHCLKWINLCLQIGPKSSSPDELYNLLNMLINRCSEYPETVPILQKEYLKIIQHLMAAKVSTVTLGCLESLLKFYPQCPSATKKDLDLEIILKFLMDCVAENETFVENVNGCLVHLAKMEQTPTQTLTFWKTFSFENNLMQMVPVQAYHRAQSIFNINVTDEDVATKPFQSLQEVATILINSFKFIDGKFQQKKWRAKPHWATVLTAIVHEIISINKKMENPNIVQRILMIYVLPRIIVPLLKLFTTFLSCVKGSLKKYRKILYFVILNTLKWSTKYGTAGLKFPYRCTREVTYTFLQKLVTKTKKLTNTETIDSDIILEIQEDLWKKKESPNLPDEDNNTSQQSSSTESNVLNFDEKLFIKALQTLHSLITSIPKLQLSVYKMVIQMVRSLLESIPKAVERQTIPSYNVANWREKIFQLVLAIHDNPHECVNVQQELPLDKITIGLFGYNPCKLNFETTSPKPQSSQSMVSESLDNMSLFERIAMLKKKSPSNRQPSSQISDDGGDDDDDDATILISDEEMSYIEICASNGETKKENQETVENGKNKSKEEIVARDCGSKAAIKNKQMTQDRSRPSQLDLSQNYTEEITIPKRSKKTACFQLESESMPKRHTIRKKIPISVSERSANKKARKEEILENEENKGKEEIIARDTESTGVIKNQQLTQNKSSQSQLDLSRNDAEEVTVPKSLKKSVSSELESLPIPKSHTLSKKLKKEILENEENKGKKEIIARDTESTGIIKNQQLTQNKSSQSQLDLSRNDAEEVTVPKRLKKTVSSELESLPIPKSRTLSKKLKKKSKPVSESKSTDFQFQLHKYELRPLSLERLFIKTSNFPSAESTWIDFGGK